VGTDQQRLRVVLDTNVLVAAHLSRNPKSPAKEILMRWQREEFDLLYSTDLRAEIVEKFAAKGIAIEAAELFLVAQAAIGIHVDVPPAAVLPVITADPDDNLVLACAVLGRATHIVTYDDHFDVLGGRYQDIQIMNALEFLGVLRDRLQAK